MAGRSETPTPFAYICVTNIMGEEGCGKNYYTEEEYTRQLMRPNALWRCPCCGNDEGYFDDDNFEEAIYGIEDAGT